MSGPAGDPVGASASSSIRARAYLTSYLRRPGLAPAGQVGLADGVHWHDDLIAYEHLDTRTVALGEPRYYQQNVTYLLAGTERALLYDAGTGLANLPAAVARFAAVPVTATCSHLHYDHVGQLGRFGDVWLLDRPEYRAATRADVLRPPLRLHGGLIEGMRRPRVRVGRWLGDGEVIDLGARRLRVLHLPGHTSDGMALHDEEAGQVFVGDFIFPGGAYAFPPTGSVDAYLRSAERLLEAIDDDTTVFVAHPGRVSVFRAPRMTRQDVAVLLTGLRAARDGRAASSGVLLRRYPAGDRMSVLTRGRWGRR